MISKLLSFTIKHLKKLLSVIKSYLFLSLIFIAICIVSIWFFGPNIKIASMRPLASPLTRMVAITAVIFLWGLNNLIIEWYQKRKKKSGTKEVETVKPRDPLKEKVEGFERSFRAAMGIVKDNWMGTGQNKGRQSFYALPWYVVLGFPAAGKTSFIVESDLKFPLAHFFSQEDAKHVEPTEDVDYWVTNDAILFDVAGQIIGHQRSGIKKDIIDESAHIWDKFLSLLREFRPRRPINGAILCLDVVDLITSDPQTRANNASLLHARLIELSEKLGTRFTVHVVLTKFDLIDGFQEFIAGLRPSQRAEPFGFAFDVYPEKDGSSWLKEFDGAYEGFMEDINRTLSDKLLDVRSTDSRRRLYAFGRQLSGLREVLFEFLSKAFQSDNFSTAPQVRGIFMASSRQEAAPINAILTAASHKYEMDAPIQPAHNGRSKQYFARDLLHSVIFREAGLAGDNIRIERSKRFLFAGSVFASTLLFIGFTSFYWLAYQDNKAKADEVLVVANNFQQKKLGNSQHSRETGQASQYLAALESLRDASSIFGDYRESNWVTSSATLNQGRKVGPEIETAYVEMLKEDYLPDIAGFIRNIIVELGQTPKGKDSNERLEALRVYLMLGDSERRNAKLVLDWMSEHWQESYEGNLSVQRSLRKHLKFAIETAGLEANLEDDLVKVAQADLRDISRDLRLYRNIEQIADRQLVSPVNLRNDIGPAYNIIFARTDREATESTPVTVKPFFTKGAFHDFFIPQNSKLTTVAIEDAWVAGERETVNYSDEDLEAFRRKVTTRYASHYIESWSNALNQLEISKFQNVDHAVDVLEEITGPENPLGRLLTRIKQETEIYKSKTIELSAEQAIDATLPFDLNREQGLRIRRAFSRLNEIIEAEEGEKTYLEDLDVALNRLYEYLKEIRQAGERSGEVALAKAKARINLEGDDPIYVIRRIGVDLPEPLNRFFDTIADESWKVVLQSAKGELQRAWNDEVYADYNLSMATRYPFQKDAEEEVSLADFESLFGPGGKIENFYKNNLIQFVEESSGKAKIIDGRELHIEPEFLKQLKRALELRESYFDEEGALSIGYTIEPKSLSGNARRAVLNIEGQLVSYTHGPRRAARIIWPNIMSGDAESKLTIFPSGRRKPQVLSFKGPWSGFRILDSGKVTDVSGGEVDLEFNLESTKITYKIRQADHRNLAGKSPLADLVLPARM
ncbi:type VI secretion system membrane subunit TssM [Flexibacterium corallicola]|uniref:type VI secretion system membrane subunit TssM n=1 Tax=Flexibacterium corallicola TaxID=3037259 RepID=UPI00286F1A9C|nr:type VI secretion system membrane subunit TssM [Pseudovibrio sp. M1P-2-3]